MFLAPFVLKALWTTFWPVSAICPKMWCLAIQCGVWPYKLMKILRFFLESAESRRNFASSKETNDKDNKKYKP